MPAAAPSMALPTPISLWDRLKHHKVIEWTLAYAAAAYTFLHGVEMLSEAQEWPHIVVRVLSLLLMLGAPIVATIAWYHGARGLKRVSGPELTIITILLFIAGSLLWAFSGAREEKKSEAQPVAASGSSAAGTLAATSSEAALAAPRTAVAVLPFANLTGDASKDYLGDGMAEELINTLTKVPGLKVPARTSTFSYKGRNTDIRQIAKDLGVGTILEGSVRAAGKRIRVTAQLINAQDGLHLWSETYDEEFTDIFKLQDKLAREIAGALRGSLSDGSAELLTKSAATPPTRDIEAYQYYLQGLSLLDRPTEENLQNAVGLFQRAIARDPEFARAYAGLAHAHLTFNATRPLKSDDVFEAERAAKKALALDPTMGWAYDALGGVSYFGSRWGDDMRQMQKALALSSEDTGIGWHYASDFLSVGYLQKARQEIVRAFSLAPASASVASVRSGIHATIGEWSDAAKYADLAVSLGMSRQTWPLPMVFAGLARQRREYSQAATILAGGAAVNAEQQRASAVLQAVYAALADPSRRPAALSAAEGLLIDKSKSGTKVVINDSATCGIAALSYELIDEIDAAYRLINGCIDQLASNAADLAVLTRIGIFSPEARSLRKDRRFQALATRLGLMDFWQEYGPPDDCDLKDSTLTCH